MPIPSRAPARHGTAAFPVAPLRVLSSAPPAEERDDDQEPIVVLDDDQVLPDAPTPAATRTRLLADLHAHAEGRVDTPAGSAALRSLGFDHPDARRAYRPGYLPAGYRSLLPPDARAVIRRLPGNSVLLPAWDEAGVIVDVAAVRLSDGYLMPTLGATPRGMLASVLATACDKLVVTDAVSRIRDGWSSAAPTLLLRGVADAQANAARLAAGGVRVVEVRVRRHAAAIVASLRLAGIEVREDGDGEGPTSFPGSLPGPHEPFLRPSQRPGSSDATDALDAPSVALNAPSVAQDASAPTNPPATPALTLVRHDAHAEQATFRWGALTLIALVPWGPSTTLEVVVEAGGLRHRDRFDLAQDPQRQRYAQVAAIRLRVPVPDLVAALTPLLPAVQALARPAPTVALPSTAAESMTEAERAEALALLRDEHLLGRLTADLDVLGWTGDADAKALTLLAAVSRLSPDPVWIALTATDPAERFPGLAALAAITPPEHLLHASRLTDHALVNTDPDALRHKLLLIDDGTAVTAPVATALKVLRAQGGLTGTTVARDPFTGRMRTAFVRAEGPVAVITAATGGPPTALRHHLVEVPVEEGPDQEERRLAARLQRLAAPSTARTTVIARLHAVQRLLRPAAVVIPPAVRGEGISPVVRRHRLLADALVGLVAAHALLHQYQRPVVDGAVAATTADVACATRLVSTLATLTSADLGRPGQRVLVAMASAVAAAATETRSFTMADLAALLPEACRWTLRSALDELAALDLVVPSAGGRGSARTYTLAVTPDEAARLARLAGVGFSRQANLSDGMRYG